MLGLGIGYDQWLILLSVRESDGIAPYRQKGLTGTSRNYLVLLLRLCDLGLGFDTSGLGFDSSGLGFELGLGLGLGLGLALGLR